MRNIRLIVAYDGTDFMGWQRQPNVPTIQGVIETAVEKLVSAKITLYGSGRTDAGVHASGQTANFKTTGAIPSKNLVKALNNLLPVSVRIKKAEEVAESFHARFDARAKTYRYRIFCAPVASPFIGRYVHHYPYPLDRAGMASAARILTGEHDFTSFAASDGPAEEASQHDKGNVRTVFSSQIIWRPRVSILSYSVRGNGFLHHMVRNIVGTLLEVGRGRLAPSDIRSILEFRDRTRAGPTSPASGLCLVKVEYDDARKSETD